MVSMTDYMVNDAVKKAMVAYKVAVTRAERARRRAMEAAFSRFGSTDVERTARSCALRRAEIARAQAIDDAASKRRIKLADIRAQAGTWIDLVPEVA